MGNKNIRKEKKKPKKSANSKSTATVASLVKNTETVVNSESTKNI
jgi:hypothetical protein